MPTKRSMLVVMGTHGMKGMQKITGSWALKVIVKSKVPFIVDRISPMPGEYHNMFSRSIRVENKEKMKMRFHG